MPSFFDYFFRAICAAGWLALLPATTASAADHRYGTPDKPRFDQRYPSGSIHSADAADTILSEAGQERQIINDQYINDQRACYQKFFVFACLEDAKERNRVAVRQVREVEVEANVVQRQAKADERDRDLSEQRARAGQEAVRRAQEQKDQAAALLEKIRENAARQEQAAERERQAEGQADVRVKAHEARLRKMQEEEAVEAPQRAASERAYREKAMRAEIHRLEVDASRKAREPAATTDPVPVQKPAQ